jgi:hypothetical protein
MLDDGFVLCRAARNHGVLLGGQLLVISEFPPGMKPAEPPEAGTSETTLQIVDDPRRRDARPVGP